MTRRPTHRSGTSLLEVLVGMGILAVGAISAFVLFPLSAINVGRALIDDRTTTCAITADGQLRQVHQRVVDMGEPSGEPYFQAMDNAGNGLIVTADDPGPSFPVAIDPMGAEARAGTPGQTALGDTGQTRLPRVSLNLITADPGRRRLALRFCSQMDGLTYTESGEVPGGTTPVGELRELRYNWMWVVQRPVNRDRFNVRQQVVVFDKRVHMYAPPGSEAVFNNVTFTPSETTITNVPTTAEIRKGSWVMDATIDPTRALRQAEFYRVLSVTEVTAANGTTTYTLEVHKPVVRADGLFNRTTPSLYTYPGSLVVMPAVVDVYERPMLTGGTGP
jgi:hypothetical protein